MSADIDHGGNVGSDRTRRLCVSDRLDAAMLGAQRALKQLRAVPRNTDARDFDLDLCVGETAREPTYSLLKGLQRITVVVIVKQVTNPTLLVHERELARRRSRVDTHPQRLPRYVGDIGFTHRPVVPSRKIGFGFLVEKERPGV